MSDYDVAVIGYGPTGMTLAALLGRLGHRVLILERYTGLYNLPRAACFDDEIMRLFQKLGIVEDAGAAAVVQRDYSWINADGETLVEIAYADPATCGWAALYMMFQPRIEDALDTLDRSLPTVELRQGTTITDLDQDDDGVTITASTDAGPATFRARYVVGADGGNGFTQRTFRRGVDDYGFQENWLVCDFAMTRSVPGLPTFQQVCDPAQPISIVTIGPQHHRFSFMLNPGETPEQATQPERVWQRVSRYITPDDAELIRAVNYVFRSRIADQWRHGRVLLAGDAAHEMPPFLGQGMCSGMRDAHNLSWKLDAILTGKADGELLDSYQVEREPHVRFITEKAIELGRVQTIRDPALARQRDERLLAERRAHRAPEKLVFPALSGRLVSSGGLLFPQAKVDDGARTALFDDVVGPGWVVVTCDPDLAAAAEGETVWRMLDGRTALVTLHGSAGGLRDVDGTYAGWFAANGARAAVVRPDWYVFGSADTVAGLSDLLDTLGAQLHAAAAPREMAVHAS